MRATLTKLDPAKTGADYELNLVKWLPADLTLGEAADHRDRQVEFLVSISDLPGFRRTENRLNLERGQLEVRNLARFNEPEGGVDCILLALMEAGYDTHRRESGA